MKTVLQSLERIYSKIQVFQEGVALTAKEKSDGISEMNALMWVQDADGLGVGWADVSDETETMPVADWVIPFVENGTALRLCGEFGKEPPLSIVAMFEESLRVLEKNNVNIPTIKYPDILPVGGEYNSRYSRNKFFFDEDQNSIKVGTQGFLRNEEGQKTIYKSAISNAEQG